MYVLEVEEGKELKGDRFNLPSKVLESLLKEEREFSGLAVRISIIKDKSIKDHTMNDEACFYYGSIMQFTAEPGTLQIPSSLFLQINTRHSSPSTPTHPSTPIQCEIDIITLRKATYISISPLTTHSNPANLKHSLESLIRRNYACVYPGLVLYLDTPQQRALKVKESFGDGNEERQGFVVKEVRPGGVCGMIDTDVEVDIVTSSGMEIDAGTGSDGLRVNGERVAADAVLQRRPLSVIDGVVGEGADIYIWINADVGDTVHFEMSSTAFGDKREGEEFKSADLVIGEGYGRATLTNCISVSIDGKSTQLTATGVCSIWIKGWNKCAFRLTLHINQPAPTVMQATESSDTSACEKCGCQFRTTEIMMHSLFCSEIATKCKVCLKMMGKAGTSSHVHCEICQDLVVDGIEKHMFYHHGEGICTCGSRVNLDEAGAHGRVCPTQIIECRFAKHPSIKSHRYCFMHLERGVLSTLGRDRVIGSGLGAHESGTPSPAPINSLECGGRTMDCIKCSKAVRIKDVAVHMLIHKDLAKPRAAPMDECLNVNCTMRINKLTPNKLGLCMTCYAPFFSTIEDPTQILLKRKIVKAYHGALVGGCGCGECGNCECRDGGGVVYDVNSAAARAVELFKLSSFFAKSGAGRYWLCVKERPKAVNIQSDGKDIHCISDKS